MATQAQSVSIRQGARKAGRRTKQTRGDVEDKHGGKGKGETDQGTCQPFVRFSSSGFGVKSQTNRRLPIGSK
jgi:hypothetical protein